MCTHGLLESGMRDEGEMLKTERTNLVMSTNQENNIDRIVICQAFLGRKGTGSYLEIGVNTGRSFMPIRASSKWGVDPAYKFRRKRLLKYRVFAALGLKEERLFRMNSDQFFQQHGPTLAKRGVDVAFLDGLHTYEQTLQDVVNTLKYLRKGGVIVIHDCNPACEADATRATSFEAFIKIGIPGWGGTWNGDVWKTIVHLRAMYPNLETVVLDCDHGVGVVRQKPARKTLQFTADQIQQLTYADLDSNRHELLGLKPAAYLWEMVEANSRP
jgi:hypothetical protein